MRAFAICVCVSMLVLAGCSSKTRWATRDGEDGMRLVREYRVSGQKDLSWVLRLDLAPASPGSYSQHWTNDTVELDLGTANGTVHGTLDCSVSAETLTCGGHDFVAKAGRVVTYSVNALGQIGTPTQSDLAAYKPL